VLLRSQRLSDGTNYRQQYAATNTTTGNVADDAANVHTSTFTTHAKQALKNGAAKAPSEDTDQGVAECAKAQVLQCRACRISADGATYELDE